MPDFLRALRHRNFRLFFYGQTLSMIGTWMHQIAAMWLVYRLSGSAAMLGLAGFAGQISMLLVAPFAGILCDRMNRHRMLLITQSLALTQSLTLATLAATGLVQVWHVITAMLVASTINAFDMPARQSMFVHLVEDRADLPNAIALNSMLMNSARLIGPAIAGLVIAAFGETICFFLNAFSYLAILIALLSMRLTPPARKAVTDSVWHSLREGLRYAFNTRPIRWLLAILATVSFLVNAYVPLMPAFVGEVLHGDARTVGTLISCAGLGAVVGTVLLAARRGTQHLAAFLRVAQLVGAVGLTLFALSSSVWLCHMLIVLVGFGMILVGACCNTLVQTIVEDDKRGRVMSLYAAAFIGVGPIGALVAGQIAEAFGVQRAFLLNGALCLLLALLLHAQRLRLEQMVQPYVRTRSATGGVAQ
jgi:MFS family permease